MRILNINDGKDWTIFTHNIPVFDGHLFVAIIGAFLESGWNIGIDSDILLHIYSTNIVVYAIWFVVLFFD